jgi:hypothetical protein
MARWIRDVRVFRRFRDRARMDEISLRKPA